MMVSFVFRRSTGLFFGIVPFLLSYGAIAQGQEVFINDDFRAVMSPDVPQSAVAPILPVEAAVNFHEPMTEAESKSNNQKSQIAEENKTAPIMITESLDLFVPPPANAILSPRPTAIAAPSTITTTKGRRTLADVINLEPAPLPDFVLAPEPEL